MPCRTASLVVLPLVFWLASAAAQARPAAPDWLVTVAAQPASLAYGKANAAVLLNQSTIEVDRAGVFTTRTRWVVRILTEEGKERAVAHVRYDTSSCRVKSMQGWLIRASGEVVPFGKKAVIDVAIYENARELYGEARQKVISAKDEATAGDVFACESVLEEDSIFPQRTWYFQNSLPVEYSGITVSVPEGWVVEGHLFNHETIAPISSGRNTTWELRALRGTEVEPLSPPPRTYHPWLGLDIRPPAGAGTRRQSFASWSDISAYFSPKFDEAAMPDAAIKTKADALVRSAGTPWDRIRLLCRYAQEVNYISINMNAAAAGGMTPRPAPRVFQCNYGDCKDKVTLLRALLRTQGIDSFPIIVSSGGGRFVKTEWPSPFQFNHCILAIRVDPATDVPARLVHSTYGSLVLFDPTNPFTPPGWLPQEDCAGHGLLLAGTGGEIIQTPSLRPDQSRIQREIAAQLFADGSIKGTVQEHFEGQLASEARREYRETSPSDFQKVIDRWIGRSMPAGRVLRLEPRDEFEQARFSLETTFTAPDCGKPMRDVLLVFKPIIVARRSGMVLRKGARTAPVQIFPSSFSEHSLIDFPPGFRVDELPPPVALNTSFGTYRAHVESVGAQQLLIERSLELSAAAIPASEYETVRLFYERILHSEQSPVVLRRK
jgi:transglutaminase-like putative cysteine protease